MNPHKWKKYSLDDADISDRTNTSAAFAFLAEIEKRKDIEEEQKRAHGNAMEINDDGSSGKVLFKKQHRLIEHRKPPSFNQSALLRKMIEKSDNRMESIVKPILKGSKVVMPEYVIGQKVHKKNKVKLNTESTANMQKSDGKAKPLLQHLFDDKDEEDEEDDD